MTYVFLHSPLDFTSTDLWVATVDSYSATEIHVSGGLRTGVFIGTFAFDPVTEAVSGTLDALNTVYDGAPEYSFNNIAVDIGELAGLAEAGDDAGAFALFFGGDDIFAGSSGRDVLFANAGNDLMEGNLGNDLLKGQAGNDTLYGGGGRDRLLGGVGDDILIGNKGKDVLFGEGGNDLLKGGDQADRLFGGKGSDVLLGLKGEDYLSGGGGFDNLSGGLGNDILKGGLGDDDMRGGGGADVFLYSGTTNEGGDVIFDFVSGEDLIRIGGTVTFADITITGDEFAVELVWNDTMVTLFGVDHTALTVADFEFV